MRGLTVAFAFLLAGLGSAAGQQVSGRADLELLADLPHSQLVAARVAFSKDSAVVCPHDHVILQMNRGVLAQHRASVMRPAEPAVEFLRTIDDTAYGYRVGLAQCRFELAIRQQVRQPDGSWRSLLVARTRRPGLTPDERRAMVDDQLRTAPRIGAEEAARHRRAYEGRATGSLGQGLFGVTRAGAVFEDAPAVCIEGIGNVVADTDGVTIGFLSGLPGDLNRFAIERADTHDDRSSIYLTKADCRYEITVGASVLKDGQWRARSVAPYLPLQVRIRKQGDPDARPPWLDRKD